MNTYQALVNNVNAACADRTPKLVLADCLEETDTESNKAKAAFIRASCYASARDEGRGTVTSNQLRANALRQQYGAQWFDEADKDLPAGFFCERIFSFTDGVIDTVNCTAESLLTLPDNVQGLAIPIRRLQIAGIEDEDTAVRVVRQLAKLHISGLKITDWDTAPATPDVENSRTRMLRAMAEDSSSQCLRHLGMSGNMIGYDDPSEAAAIGNAIKDMPKLQQLDMGANFIGSSAPDFGKAIKHMPRLQQLNMGGNSIGAHAPAFGEAIKGMPQLQRLDMGNNRIGTYAYAFCETIKGMPQLQQLNMRSNNIGNYPERIPALAESLQASALHSVDFSYNHLSNESRAILRQALQPRACVSAEEGESMDVTRSTKPDMVLHL